MDARSITRPPLESEEAERCVISCFLIDGNATVERALAAGMCPDWFSDSRYRVIFRAIVQLHHECAVLDDSILAEKLKETCAFAAAGGYAGIMEVTGQVSTTANAEQFIRYLRSYYERRETLRFVVAMSEALTSADDDAFKKAQAQLFEFAASGGPLRQRLNSARFRLDAKPPAPEIRFHLIGKPICTPGNLTNLIAQAKAGKSAFVGAMLASAICADAGRKNCDTLGLIAAPPAGRHVIHLDTEQSPEDHWALVERALRRADANDQPSWLDSYPVAGFTTAERRAMVPMLLQDAHRRGGVHSLIIDGSADLVNDPNDPEESIAFVAELHRLAIQYQCPIINVVHENPGGETGKARGHLGSQLERKAESNLRLKKTDETTTVFSERMRRAPILESEGPCFRWANEAQMHVSTTTRAVSRDDAKRRNLGEMMESAFEGKLLTHGQLCERLIETRSYSKNHCEKLIRQAREIGVISFGAGKYWGAPSSLN